MGRQEQVGVPDTIIVRANDYVGASVMNERCNVCNAMMADHSCYRCGYSVCSSCIDENGLLCRNCKLKSEDDIDGIKIGYGPLKKMVNMPLFIVGIAVMITGMVVITSSFASQQMPQQPGGSIYIFPFPLAFDWSSPDLITIIPLIIGMVALPVIMIFLMFRKFTRL